MNAFSRIGSKLGWAAALCGGLCGAAAAAEPPTFSEDVLPIFQKNCVSCHRAGEGTPMELGSYEAVRPWVKSIRRAVSEETMPPWLADREFGHFSNEMGLTAAEIATVVNWAKAGAPQGDPSKAPPAPVFTKGWAIGEPDQVFKMTDSYTLGAEGPDEYKYFTIPTNLTEDKWVTAVEIRPGNRNVVHHVIAFIQPPGMKMRSDEGGNTKLNSYVPESPEAALEAVRKGEEMQKKMEANAKKPLPIQTGNLILGGMAPGTPAWVAKPGEGRLLKAGSSLVFQMHYHRNGKEETDQSYVGVKYADAPAAKQRITMGIFNMAFAVPPHADNYRVDSWYTFNEDVHIHSFMPHMHLRGKAFEYIAEYPDGRQITLLRIPRYDFAWQYQYECAEPIAIEKGVTIHCIAHMDNSANNPANPDPTRVVRFGEPTEDEMMIGWIDVTRDGDGNAPAPAAEEKKVAANGAE